MTPPIPLSYPKMIHYPLDPARHYSHKLIPSFIHSSKPLLIGSDVGMQLDELMIFGKEYANPEQILDEEDEMILNETIMNVSYKNSATEKASNAKKQWFSPVEPLNKFINLIFYLLKLSLNWCALFCKFIKFQIGSEFGFSDFRNICQNISN